MSTVAHNPALTSPQRAALKRLHNDGPFDEFAFKPSFDLPSGYVAGWVTHSDQTPWLYVGVSQTGEVSS